MKYQRCKKKKEANLFVRSASFQYQKHGFYLVLRTLPEPAIDWSINGRPL